MSSKFRYALLFSSVPKTKFGYIGDCESSLSVVLSTLTLVN